MKPTKLPAALTAAFALALSGATFAATPPPVDAPMTGDPLDAQVDEGFDQLDRDGDGFIVVTDVPPEHALALQFAVADLDRDQRLSRDEFDAFQEDPEEEEAEE